MGKSLARRVHKSILSYASNKFYFGIFNSLLLNWILVFYSGKQTIHRSVSTGTSGHVRAIASPRGPTSRVNLIQSFICRIYCCSFTAAYYKALLSAFTIKSTIMFSCSDAQRMPLFAKAIYCSNVNKPDGTIGGNTVALDKMSVRKLPVRDREV